MSDLTYRPILLKIQPEQQLFSPVGSGSKDIPLRNRINHAQKLRNDLNRAIQNAQTELSSLAETRSGTYLDFKITENSPNVVSALDDRNKGNVRLCNMRKTENQENPMEMLATVWFSDKTRNVLNDKINSYENDNSSGGNPRYQNLFARIEEISQSSIESFWRDDPLRLPTQDKQWCEVWLADITSEEIKDFERILQNKGIAYSAENLCFATRTIKLIEVNLQDLSFLIQRFDYIAEFRCALSTASFWCNLNNKEQGAWIDDLSSRLIINKDSKTSVCLLDTGINAGHKLLNPIVDFCLSVEDGWGTDDHHGHGTEMAGLAIYGNLLPKLQTELSVPIPFRLDSVKLLPPPSLEATPPKLWGIKTSNAISLSIIEDPQKFYIYNCAVSASSQDHRGRPSSWSAAIDRTIFENRCVFVQAAGNIVNSDDLKDYPDSCLLTSIHDPAQAWNALTVGSYTQLTTLTDTSLRNYKPLAKTNEISPFTTTSFTWDSAWPIKPEIVMEGGNSAIEEAFCSTCDDLSLLTTHFQPTKNLFTSTCMTSASTALAANFIARLKEDFPELEAEALRGLIVHSAQWTEEMIQQFKIDLKQKKEIAKLMRICGYGVPDYERASSCAKNSLTLLVQREIQPFRSRSGSISFNKIDIFDLPWPKDILEELGEAPVEMRVTLSFFIEPNPGDRGWKNRYRYSSFGLEFDLNSPMEDKTNFIMRINKKAQNEDYESTGISSASYWLIGSQQRGKGSIQSDIWKGTAAELSTSHYIAVYPKGGWWKEKIRENCAENKAHYALIVTITTPEENVDIYLPVAQQVGIVSHIQIST